MGREKVASAAGSAAYTDRGTNMLFAGSKFFGGQHRPHARGFLLAQPCQDSVCAPANEFAPGDIANALISVWTPPPFDDHHNLPIDFAAVSMF